MIRSKLPHCETPNIHYFVTKHKKENFVEKIIGAIQAELVIVN